MFDFLSKKFSSIVASLSGQSKLTEKNIIQSLEQIKQALLEADVPYQLVDQFVVSIKDEALGQKVFASVKPGDQLVKLVHDKLVLFLGEQQALFAPKYPAVVMVMGLQGSGKTTTLAKLAHRVHQEKKGSKNKILCASVDFYRPAAIDQLEQVALKAGAFFYRATSTDPVSAAREIHAYFKKEAYDLLLLDTAGRLHVDNVLLQELRDVDIIVQPQHKLLVLDAMTGQESLAVARAFDKAVGFDGAILSKMDSDTRGGAAFAFRYALKKPILFVGVGEKVSDLELFYPERMAGRILGMGDVVSLVEKAQEKISNAEADRTEKAWKSGGMTLQDFAYQLKLMNRVGSLGSIAKMLPGAGGMGLSPQVLEQGERELKMFQAIICSMTLKERSVPRLLDGSRKKRVAKGAGVGVEQVNLLLARFEQMQQFAKLLQGAGRSSRFPKLF
ncbi:signal recognition particle protein [Candidatus Dependentiae bacterium HGW-Dependentiae-1]|nr:MAG: signal recognition particle protein [Candidatus Dependentiae bacterium HGW-Dependentiae-1]